MAAWRSAGGLSSRSVAASFFLLPLPFPADVIIARCLLLLARCQRANSLTPGPVEARF
jgi:hypothetical protein